MNTPFYGRSFTTETCNHYSTNGQDKGIYYLVDIFSVSGFKPDAELNCIIFTRIKKVEANSTGRRASHPDAIVSPHDNDREECGEPLQACIVHTPS